MLRLLLKTRIRYSKNYLRTHFDRITLIELGLILLIFAALVLRSPADVGYSLRILGEPQFADWWAYAFVLSYPWAFLLFVVLAYFAGRRRVEWRLLGALPIDRSTLLSYHLARFE